MNLGGVPTQGGQGTPLPRLGPPLRDIASEAVRKVYNHGAGKARGKYENEREALARRFRIQYGSEGIGADGEGQGNVQPIFVGAFDTVAALRSNIAGLVVLAALAGLGAVGAWIGDAGRSEEHTSELQSLMRISYAVFCLTKKN